LTPDYLWYLSTSERNDRRGLEHVPEWLQSAQQWKAIIARKGFGRGSPQELAAIALAGKSSHSVQAVSDPPAFGVKCVIAESFSWFIEQNMPLIGLLDITAADGGFYKRAQNGKEIRIHMGAREVEINEQRFQFGSGHIATELHRY
jgi:3-isopropylmalate dehydratase small subunit